MSFGVPLPESESEFPSYPHYPHPPQCAGIGRRGDGSRRSKRFDNIATKEQPQRQPQPQSACSRFLPRVSTQQQLAFLPWQRTEQRFSHRSKSLARSIHPSLVQLMRFRRNFSSSLFTSTLVKGDQLLTTHPSPSTCNQDLISQERCSSGAPTWSPCFGYVIWLRATKLRNLIMCSVIDIVTLYRVCNSQERCSSGAPTWSPCAPTTLMASGWCLSLQRCASYGSKAHRLVYHSTLGWRVIKKKRVHYLDGQWVVPQPPTVRRMGVGCSV